MKLLQKKNLMFGIQISFNWRMHDFLFKKTFVIKNTIFIAAFQYIALLSFILTVKIHTRAQKAFFCFFVLLTRFLKQIR